MKLQSLLIIFLLSLNFFVKGQNSREDLVSRYLNIGKTLLQQQKYDTALVVLKNAFIQDATLPDELLYFYGLALYHAGSIDQSKKLLNKYISIVHSDAEHYVMSNLLVSKIDEIIELQMFKCADCDGIGYLYTNCTYCNDTGAQTCDICSGKGKVISGSTQGMKFSTCRKCKGEGKLNCIHCNGTLKIEQRCKTCNGKGKIRENIDKY